MEQAKSCLHPPTTHAVTDHTGDMAMDWQLAQYNVSPKILSYRMFVSLPFQVSVKPVTADDQLNSRTR